MFKIATFAIAAYQGASATGNLSTDLAGATAQVQASQGNNYAMQVKIARLGNATGKVRDSNAAINIKIAKDKATLQGLTVKFYAAQAKHDAFAKNLDQETKRLAKAKALLTAERNTQKRLRDELRTLNNKIKKSVNFIKKTKKKVEQKSIKQNVVVQKARRDARKEKAIAKATMKAAIHSTHSKKAIAAAVAIKKALISAKGAAKETAKALKTIAKNKKIAKSVKKTAKKVAKKAAKKAKKSHKKTLVEMTATKGNEDSILDGIVSSI